jgi:hypothetical protein
MKLTIELVPKSSWGNNLRSEANLSKEAWDKLRKSSYKKAGYRCEVCKGQGPKWPVECHEIWDYDDEKGVQTLKGLVSLCPICHKAKHLGRTLSVEPEEIKTEVLLKIMDLNSFTEEQLEEYIISVFDKWQERSSKSWALDLTWLEGVL